MVLPNGYICFHIYLPLMDTYRMSAAPRAPEYNLLKCQKNTDTLVHKHQSGESLLQIQQAVPKACLYHRKQNQNESHHLMATFLLSCAYNRDNNKISSNYRNDYCFDLLSAIRMPDTLVPHLRLAKLPQDKNNRPPLPLSRQGTRKANVICLWPCKQYTVAP